MVQEKTTKAPTKSATQNSLQNGMQQEVDQRPQLNVQRALLRADALTPPDLMYLQRSVGNQMVQRILSSSLAQRAAKRLQRDDDERATSTGLEGSVGLAGGAAPPEVTSALNKKQGGAQMSKPLRDKMEHGFGADFGGVRIHTGGAADRLNRSLNAKAFTHGKDIYFKKDAYQPGSRQGQHLLAHELTHVVQQTGGPRPQRKLNRQTLDNPPMVSQRVARQPHNAESIQRLVSRQNFEKLAGRPGLIARFRRSTYNQLLNALTQYEMAKGDEEKKAALQLILRLCDQWLERHTERETKTDSAGNEYKEGKVHKHKDLRKDMFITSLENEAKAELNQKNLPKNSPSHYIDKYQNISNSSDQISDSLSNLDTGLKYTFSILAFIQHTDFLDFTKESAKLEAQNRGKLIPHKGKRSNKEIKKAAATSVVDRKYGNLAADQRKSKIKELRNVGGQVGHAWLKFSILDNAGQKTKEESVGFWPLKYFPHPKQAVPGKFKYPDTVHDDDTNVRRKDVEISADQYQRGMNRVTELMKSPPLYKLVDYNCTKFVMQIAQAIGVAFPAEARISLPVHATLPVSIGTWDPNSLYHAMGKDEGAYNPKEKSDQEEQARVDAEQEELNSFPSVKLRFSTTPFTPLNGDGDSRTYHRNDGPVWIVQPEEESELYDPYSGDSKPCLKVKLMYNGKLVTAWMHTEALRE